MSVLCILLIIIPYKLFDFNSNYICVRLHSELAFYGMGSITPCLTLRLYPGLKPAVATGCLQVVTYAPLGVTGLTPC
ncbi:unnamed protein product [Schistosoma bovis]|nr:unnamed protein product [Schistosoma bovis]